MPKRKYNKKIKNKNTNNNKNNNIIHIHLNNKKQLVHHKQHVKKEIVQVPQIKTFTPLHQMTNYVPIPGITIPQASQMMSHPTIPVQRPLVQNNPLVNPLRDLTGGNKQAEDAFYDKIILRAEAKKRKEEEEKRIQEYKDNERQHSGKKLGEIDHSKFLFVDSDKSGSHDVSGPLFHEGLSNDSEHKSVPIEAWGKDAYVLPIRQKDAKPTPKKQENVMQKDTSPEYETDEFGNKFPKDEEKKQEVVKKTNPLKKQEGETQEQWAKRMRDNTAKKEKEASERAAKALSELNTLDQGEEEKHEPPNQYVKDTRGRKTLFSDDDNKKYLDINDYREFVRLQNEYQDGVFGTNSSEYEKLKRLRTKRSNNKKAGKTF